MAESVDNRWLSPEALANYISVRVDRLPRYRRAGKLPEPSLHLGPHTPRYDRLAVDRMFFGNRDRAPTSLEQKVHRYVEERRLKRAEKSRLQEANGER